MTEKGGSTPCASTFLVINNNIDDDGDDEDAHSDSDGDSSDG